MFFNIKIDYLCTVFFMVLDLRLTMKIGCRDDNLFFFMEVPFCSTCLKVYYFKSNDFQLYISIVAQPGQTA